MTLSAALHLALLAFAWLSTLYEPPRIEFITYEVELVSPPPAAQAQEVEVATEEIVVQRPDPEPRPPEPEVEEVVPVEAPEERPPEQTPEREVPSEQPPEPDEEVSVAAAPTEPPEEATPVSGEGLEVRIEGLRRDYPEYYNNIIRQIFRCFRWRQGGGWQATVYFVIRRDGTVSDLDFLARSGNAAFDFEAMGAVDCAGQGRFGPLPEDLPWDRMPVKFDFRPPGGTDDPLTALGMPTQMGSEE
jgi:outer membrane biosynthesis protein TonB